MADEKQKAPKEALKKALKEMLEGRRARKPEEPEETMIGVYLPDECLLRAHALDLPPKIKNKVLSSILQKASNPAVDPHGEWGETWGETPQE